MRPKHKKDQRKIDRVEKAFRKFAKRVKDRKGKRDARKIYDAHFNND